MRLISASWVVPVARPPLRDGAVLADGDLIVEVGPAESLVASHPEAEREHFYGCIITPGLVNAHTHLALTALAGVVSARPFAEWLPKLVAAMKPWGIADHEASGVVGAEECLLSGVTVVGDIAYGAAEVASASSAGLGGVYYWELLGMAAEAVPGELAALRYPSDPVAFGPRAIAGLSPHSPYTAGPDLLRAVHAEAARLGVPFAIHVAESRAELDLLRDGSGPLAGVTSRTVPGFAPPGTTTVQYLADLGVLEHATAVHACYATDADIALLAAKARGVVTCPRSNLYLDNPPPSVTRLLASGLATGVGTDSSASNLDLDLMEEVRAVRHAEPDLSAEQLLALATIGGARAIGVPDRFGALMPGMQADLTVFAVDGGNEPLAALLDRAGRRTAHAVMSGGEWRVRAGELLVRDAAAAARAADAAARSRAALAAAGQG